MVRGNLYIRRDQVWKTVRAPETAQLCRLTEAPISVFLSCLNPFNRSLLTVWKLSHQFLHWIHKRILCLVIKTQSQPPCNKQTKTFLYQMFIWEMTKSLGSGWNAFHVVLGSPTRLLPSLCSWSSWPWRKWRRLLAGLVEREMGYFLQVCAEVVTKKRLKKSGLQGWKMPVVLCHLFTQGLS